MSAYVIPFLIVLLLTYSQRKKIRTYDTFVKGVKNGFKLVVEILPYIIAIMVAVSLLRESGLAKLIVSLTSPIFEFLGIPSEVIDLVLLRPFTGSGSYAILNDIFVTYGPDSYISRCSACIMGSSETIFYVATVYFSKTQVKKLGVSIPIALMASLLSAILSCLICKFW